MEIKREPVSEKANVEDWTKRITALNVDAEGPRMNVNTQFEQETQQKKNRIDMNRANKQEQQEQLKADEEEAAVRGQKEFNKLVAENEANAPSIIE
jgi:hypothetical protein